MIDEASEAFAARLVRLLRDQMTCPACTATLHSSRCSACGVDLAGARGDRLLEVSAAAADLLTERAWLLVALRAEAADRLDAVASPTSTPQPSPAPAPGVPGGRAAESAGAGQGTPPRHLPGSMPPRPGRRIGGQGLLVGVGTVLLSVASLVFLAVSWGRLGLGGRAAVAAGLTSAVLTFSAWLRRRLPSTGEALGCLGVVLLLGDAWALRRLDLFGTASWPLLGYAAGAVLIASLLLGAWGVIGRVRAGTVAAAVLAPLAPALAGARFGESSDDLAPVVAGLLLLACVAAGRRAVPHRLGAERVILRIAAALGVGCAVPCLALLAVGARYGVVTGLLAVTAGVGVLQVWSEGRTASPSGLRPVDGWSAAAAAATTAAGAAAAGWIATTALADALWWVGVGPVLAGAAAVAATAFAVAGRGVALAVRPVMAVAAASTAVTAVPAAVSVVDVVRLAAGAAAPPWTEGVGAALLHSPAASDVTLWGAAPLGLVAGALAVLAVLALGTRTGTVGRASRPAGPARAAVTVGAAGAGSLVLGPMLPLGAVVPLLAVVAVLIAALASAWPAPAPDPAPTPDPAPPRGELLALAAGCGVLAVVLAWRTHPLTVPATLGGAAALLAARRVVAATARPAVVAGAAAALLVAVGAAPAPDWVLSDRLVAAGIAGAVHTALVCLLPGLHRRAAGRPTGRRWTAAERAAAAVPALLAGIGGLAAASHQVSAGAATLGRVQAGLAAWLVLGVAVAVLDRRRAGALPAPVAAGALAALAAALADTTLPDRAGRLPWLADPAPTEAAVVAVSAVALAALHALTRGRLPGNRRSSAAQFGLAITAAVPLLRIAAHPDGQVAWVVLLELGVGAAAVATLPGRARVGWLASVLITGSSWVRLRVSDVGVVEAYTLPAALALLGLAGLTAWRTPRGRPVRVRSLGAGLTLALIPSVLASSRGPDLRPGLLIAAGTGLVAGAEILRRRGRDSRLADLPARRPAGLMVAVGVLFATTGAGARALAGAAGLSPGGVGLLGVERWSFAGAGVALAAVVPLARGLAVPLPRVLRGPGGPGPGLGGAGVAAAVAGSVALVVASVPSLVAALLGHSQAGSRPGAVLGLAATLGCALWLGPPSMRRAGAASRLGGLRLGGFRLGVPAVTATVLAVAAGLIGLAVHAAPFTEAWTLPVAAVLLAAGVHRLLDGPAAGSVGTLGAGLAVALLPNLWLASVGDSGPRVVLVAVLGGLALATGASLGLRAPTLAGAGVLVVHAAVQVEPSVARIYATTPGWVPLAVVGATLLALGATYEKRVRDLRAVWLRLAQFR